MGTQVQQCSLLAQNELLIFFFLVRIISAESWKSLLSGSYQVVKGIEYQILSLGAKEINSTLDRVGPKVL